MKTHVKIDEARKTRNDQMKSAKKSKTAGQVLHSCLVLKGKPGGKSVFKGRANRDLYRKAVAEYRKDMDLAIQKLVVAMGRIGNKTKPAR